MATYTPHLYLTFGGFLGTSANQPGEIWQCGFRIGVRETSGGTGELVVPVAGDQELMLQDAIPALTTWMTSSDAAINAQAKLTWAKVAAISATGTYLFPDAAYDDFTAVPGAGSSPKPFQVARVISLGGARNRGRASKGRIYTPVPGSTVSVDGTVSPTTGLVAARTLVESLNGAALVERAGDATTESVVGIFSGVDGSWQPVTRVGGNAVLDTQRRRTDQIQQPITWQDLT